MTPDTAVAVPRTPAAKADAGIPKQTAAANVHDRIELVSIFFPPPLGNCRDAGRASHGASMTPPAPQVRRAAGCWRGGVARGRVWENARRRGLTGEKSVAAES